jgi:hypothetical protein
LRKEESTARGCFREGVGVKKYTDSVYYPEEVEVPEERVK